MDANTVILGLTWFVVFLFSTTLHEAAHAWAALRLGDRTAYEGGQVSLDPLPHIRRSPIGMLLIPLVSYAVNGWMMGWASAPYDPMWAHRHPKRAALMAAAGPAANLLLVIASGLLIKIGVAIEVFTAPNVANFTAVTAATTDGWIAGTVTPLSIVFSLNLLLFAFNLLPLPPLDGSAILPGLMGDDTARSFQALLRQPAFAMLGLLAAWKVFPLISRPLRLLALNVLYPGAGYH
jgi:Zn-dependent protease